MVVSIYIHKWAARFLLVMLVIASANASVGQLDWTELANEIDNKQWCGKSNYCDSLYETDDASTTEFPIEVRNERTSMNPSEMEDNRFLERLCHCDEECHSYGDCCYDASAADVRTMSNNNITRVEFSRNSLACLPLRFKDNDYTPDQKYYIYMVDKCPSTWLLDDDDESLPALCQKKTNPSDYTHLMDIPVLSLDTKRTYANVFCARCHSDAARLARWNVSIECNKDLKELNIRRAQMFNQPNYGPGLRRWVLQNPPSGATSSIRCHIVIDEFRNFTDYLKTTGSRRCLPKIESCAVDWKNASDEIKCHAYTFLVQSKPSPGSRTLNVYKNPHCAKCNHIELNETRCYFPSRMDPKFRVSPSSRSQYSFSMLIDFDFGGSGAGGGKNEIVCGPKEIFDHFHDRCHAVICGTMFVNEGGTCIPKSELKLDVPPAGNWLNSSCQRLVLTENLDYIQLENGSLILNSTGAILQPEDYEPIEVGQNVSICAVQPDSYFKYASTGQHYMSDICLVISVVCLALHIIVHMILPKLRNLPGKNLLSLSCALFMAQLLFLTGIGLRDTVGYRLCATLGILTHWFYLAAFFWMNVMGFDICRTFTGSLIRHRGMQGRGQRCTFIFYSVYAWGFPTLVVSLGLMLDLTHLMDDYAPEYGTRVCWISNKTGLGFFFILPVAVLLLENLILFSLTVFSILKQRRAARFAVDKKQSYRKASESKSVTERLQPPPGPTAAMRHSSTANNKQKIRFILYIKLGLIMGMGWIFGFIAALAKIPALWYPFIFFNALQGAFIFVAFCCKRKIYFMLYQWATNRPHPSDSSSSSRTTASSNKPSTSTQRASVAVELPSNSAAEFESHPNRFSHIVKENTQPQPSLAAERLLPQVAAVEIARNWISSASPVSRAKRNLPRVVVTKHFVNDDEFHPGLFANGQNSVCHLYVQNNNHSASSKS